MTLKPFLKLLYAKFHTKAILPLYVLQVHHS